LRSYYVPTFIETPDIRIEHLETPSPFTYNGVKGVGEGGRMCAPAAVVSAIEDALEPYGVRIDEVPVTPEKILRWLSEAGSRP
jgi:CO/xanthine dehydrogenase Mo-binding subunit